MLNSIAKFHKKRTPFIPTLAIDCVFRSSDLIFMAVRVGGYKTIDILVHHLRFIYVFLIQIYGALSP